MHAWGLQFATKPLQCLPLLPSFAYFSITSNSKNPLFRRNIVMFLVYIYTKYLRNPLRFDGDMASTSDKVIVTVLWRVFFWHKLHMFHTLCAFLFPETAHETSKTYSLSNPSTPLALFPLTLYSGTSQIPVCNPRILVVPECNYDTMLEG